MEDGARCTGVGRRVRRPSPGTRATSLTSVAAPYSPRGQVTPGQLLQLLSQLMVTQLSTSHAQPSSQLQLASQPQFASHSQLTLPKNQLSQLQLFSQLPQLPLSSQPQSSSHSQLWSQAQSVGVHRSSLRATSGGTVGRAREKGGAGQGGRTSRRCSPKWPVAVAASQRTCQCLLVGENAPLPHRVAPFGCSGASSRSRRRAGRGGQASAGHAQICGDPRHVDV